MTSDYNEDYFERGIELGISGYTNYRWLPELTIPMIARLIMDLKIRNTEKILDFGCAKGYKVKAFKLLGFQAWGCDISDYAVNNCDVDVKDDIFKIDSVKDINSHYNWIIAKDVLEHISYTEIHETLKLLRQHTDRMFCAIPLGENGRYNCPAYELDITHVIKETMEWWTDMFKTVSFNVERSVYSLNYMKQNWIKYSKGNGFFVLS